MSLRLFDEEIHCLIAYARDKFAAERLSVRRRCGTSEKCSPSRSKEENAASLSEKL
jgi:hypothetical protein